MKNTVITKYNHHCMGKDIKNNNGFELTSHNIVIMHILTTPIMSTTRSTSKFSTSLLFWWAWSHGHNMTILNFHTIMSPFLSSLTSGYTLRTTHSLMIALCSCRKFIYKLLEICTKMFLILFISHIIDLVNNKCVYLTFKKSSIFVMKCTFSPFLGCFSFSYKCQFSFSANEVFCFCCCYAFCWVYYFFGGDFFFFLNNTISRGRNFRGNIVGLAYKSSMCYQSYGVGIVQDQKLGLNFVGVTATHEVGHILGMSHDDTTESKWFLHYTTESKWFLIRPCITLARSRTIS